LHKFLKYIISSQINSYVSSSYFHLVPSKLEFNSYSSF
jgi:hypothetical protein